MTVKVKDLVARFEKSDFKVQPSPETPTTSFSIKQFIKLFDSATKDEEPPHQSINDLALADFDSNKAPYNTQFEKTSSSKEREVFPDTVCENNKTVVNRTEPGTLENEKTNSQNVQQKILGYENMVSLNSVEVLKCAPTPSSRVVAQLIALFEGSGYQPNGKREFKNGFCIKDNDRGKSAPDGDGYFEKVSNKLVNICPVVQEIGDDDNIRQDHEDEIQPNLDHVPTRPENTKTPLHHTEHMPTTTADTQGSQGRKRKYLTRYLIKLGGTGARIARKKKLENGHDEEGDMMDKDVDLTRKSKKLIPSFLSSYLKGCFGHQKNKSPSKVKTALAARSTRTGIHTSHIIIPMSSGNVEEHLGDVNIELTITAALRT